MPNASYDPVQVATLDADHVEAMVADALAAFAEGHAGRAEAGEARPRRRAPPIALANREIGALPPHARKEAGAASDRPAAGSTPLCSSARSRSRRPSGPDPGRGTVDVTLPVQPTPPGAVHPITALMSLMEDVFVGMGWEVAEGPELEAEWLNFDALNFIPDHPARTMQDTLFVEPENGGIVLRTHTSPVQVRTMLTREPPIYVVCPGRVYRADEYDATHPRCSARSRAWSSTEGITLGHLAGPSTTSPGRCSARPDPPAAQLLPLHRAVRRGRPPVLRLQGRSVGDPEHPCRTCKSEGWIEWGGCGMVNPRVLEACGIDHDVYTGFAFGMGVERTLMFRHNGGTCATWWRVTSASAMPSAWPDEGPLRWLREYAAVPAEMDGRTLADALIRAGLEVETVEGPVDVGGPLVIGRVVDFVDEPQTNGKTIRWCQVDVGEHNPESGARGIVCGAHNFDTGDSVVVALAGAVLPGDFAIAARKTYGHVSDGMICSARARRRGRPFRNPGADEPDLTPGADAAPVLGLRDEVLDIAVTPDRGYCLSIRGLAREAAQAYGRGVP